MQHTKKATNELSNDECRVIRINRDAIYELLRETFMENKYEYFDLGSSQQENLLYWNWDDQTGDFICFVSENFHLDFDHIDKLVPLPTTDSLYSPNRYLAVYPNQKDN